MQTEKHHISKELMVLKETSYGHHKRIHTTKYMKIAITEYG